MTIYYYLLFISVLFFVIGFIIGFMLLIQRYVEEKEKFVQQKTPSSTKEEDKDDEDATIQKIEEALTEFNDNECTNSKQNGFKERIVDMEHSFTNTLDETTQKAYIEQNRSKQDSAYNYIEQASEKNNENE